jgi:hypothetical protein
MSNVLIETDEQTGRVVRRLLRIRVFAETYPNYGTYEAIRKRIQKRYSNGLVAAGAVVETAYGKFVDPSKYAAWVMRPRCSNANHRGEAA